MSNQFERVQKREQEEKQKAIQRKVDSLLDYFNLAIIKYGRTLEIYLTTTDNGSIMGKRKVIRADRTGLMTSYNYLGQRRVQPQLPVWWDFLPYLPSKYFLKEIEKREKELGINIVPGLKITQFGIVPQVIFAEPVQKPLLPETKGVDTPKSIPAPINTDKGGDTENDL